MLDFDLGGKEQIFFTLTSEEAAVIEGGSSLHLVKIKCKAAGQDGINQPHLFVNGIEIWSKEVTPGKEAQIGESRDFVGFANIQLYNQDGQSDFIDSFIIPAGVSAEKEQPLIGSESKKCVLTYMVVE